MDHRKTIRKLMFLSLLAMGSLTMQAQTVTKEFKSASLKSVLEEVEKQTVVNE